MNTDERAIRAGLQIGNSHLVLDRSPFAVRAFTANLASGHHEYTRIEHSVERDGVVVIPVNTDGELLLIRHPRPIVGDFLWEFPRGMGDAADRNAAETAGRELREETGLKSEKLTCIGAIYPDSGMIGSIIQVFLAEDSKKIENARDTDECLEHKWVRRDDLLHQLLASPADGISLAAYSLLCAAR